MDPEKNDHRCTACGICINACPNHSIDVEKMVDEAGKPERRAAKYSYNLATCMFCNLCVEVCPFAAIIMSDEYSSPSLKRDTMIKDLVAEKFVLSGSKTLWWQSKFKVEE
jgi:NADH-quinone oxidoreductase subunit I